jgi:hypothetical protein
MVNAISPLLKYILVLFFGILIASGALLWRGYKTEPAPVNDILEDLAQEESVKHTVPLGEIVGGGPPMDGIPSIDNPDFISVSDVDYVEDDELGIAFSRGGTNRFYPYHILVYHEIVNDVIDGTRVLVTYCPLCLSGIVFDPLVDGERVEFGTSGKLWQSNLVMYDRKTGSYWSQILGQAIVGDMAGEQLEILPSDVVRYSNWKRAHPDGEVLSRETGAFRFYGQDPYGDYYTSDRLIFSVQASDERLELKDYVLGIVVNGNAKAYYPPSVKRDGEVVDNFQGKQIVAQYDEDLDVVHLFERDASGQQVRIHPFPSFWFSWVAAHPDTELYK